MQCYVINLDRSPDRLKFMQDQAEVVGLEFARISAIDGKQLPQDFVENIQSSSSEFQPVDRGNIGLFLSHKLAWQALIDSGNPQAAVFEDDAILSPTINQTLYAIDQRQPEFDIIKLETTLRKIVCSRQSIELGSGDSLRKLLSWHGGTAGYVISQRGAKRMLSEEREVPGIIDQIMFHPRSPITSKFNIQQLNPAACIQSQFLPKESSTVFGSTLGKPGTGGRLFRYGPWVDARRLVRRQLESLRRRSLANRPANEELIVSFAAMQLDRRTA